MAYPFPSAVTEALVDSSTERLRRLHSISTPKDGTSGIIHVLQSGCRWQDCPPEYGPSITVYNRYHRWAQRGIWEGIFRDLTAIVGTHYENSIDSTIIKAHRSASGKKGAAAKPSAKAEADARRKFMPQRTTKAVRSRSC